MGQERDVFDITIVGGGPVGLYGAYTAGMRQLRTKIVESMGELGGQVTALYPEKEIYDVGGFPAVLGKEFVKMCAAQGLQYGPTVCLEERVQMMERLADGVFRLTTSKGEHFTRAVLLTVGIGAFTPRKLGAPGEEELYGKGVQYAVTDPKALYGKRVLVVGGGDSAVDWANMLKEHARVTLVHRRDGFRAHEASVQALRDGRAEVRLFWECKAIHGDGRVEAATIFHNKTKEEETLPVDAVVLSLGFVSSLGGIRDWGLRMEGDSIVVNSKGETSVPGIYAAGDVVTYPGKIKLIATGFGEVATAVNNAKTYLDPTAKAFPGHSSTRGH